MSATAKVTMILMPHDRADGTIDRDDYRYLGDARMPSRITYSVNAFDQAEQRIVGSYVRRQGCEDGRHLFDIIESAVEVEGESNEYGESITPDMINFNANLTCVRCGFIESWEGVRKSSTRNPTAIDPTPIRAGALTAQEINGSQGYGRDTSTWSVHDATGTAVGVIAWASGKRGRAFFQGRLFAWPPEDETVEGKTPMAVLRKISTRAATIATEPAAIAAGA